jgi:FKBP-type peptidyl-prolyl cis-trans isomerase
MNSNSQIVTMRFNSIMKYFTYVVTMLTVVGFLFPGCIRNSDHPDHDPFKDIHPDTLTDVFDYANKALNKHEEEKINQYVRRHNLNLITTPTGLRYRIYVKGTGDNAKHGDVVIYHYTLRLINGTVITSSAETGPQEVVVEKSEMISGLHELMQYMNVGAKGRAIIPSRLGHGLTGDQQQIPKGATLIYDIEIVDIITFN